MKNRIIMFWAIVAIVLVSLFTIFHKENPTDPIIKLGLDLVGGSRLELQAQKTETISAITPDMMDSLTYCIQHLNYLVHFSKLNVNLKRF